MELLKRIFLFLQGKKTSIATICGAVLMFTLGRGYIMQDTAELLSYILLALGLSVNATSYVVGRMSK